MNFDFGDFAQIWEDFLNFLDRSFQWLKYIFTGEGEWPPVDYPDIDD